MSSTSSATTGERTTGNVTLKQIARDLGVSHQLVSYALNDTGTVGEEMRQRIKETAERMGYRRNGSAMAMKSGRFGNVALLLSTDGERSHLPQELWEGIHDELAAHDLHLTLARLPEQKLSDAETVPKILREWMCDGLLIDFTHRIPASLLELVERHQLPAVWLNFKHPTDCVYADDFEAGRRAGEHLLELGHTRIAYLSVAFSDGQDKHYSETDRREGVASAARAAGAQLTTLPAPTSGETALAAIAELLQSAARPSAIIGYGKEELALVMLLAAQIGLQVPRDLSLLIFGEKSAPPFAFREVSQMVLPQEEVGREAVRLLLRKLDNPSFSAPPCAVPFDFAPGELCAPPLKTRRKTS